MKDWMGLLRKRWEEIKEGEAQELAEEQAANEAVARELVSAATHMPIHSADSVAAWCIFGLNRQRGGKTIEETDLEAFTRTMEAVVTGWPREDAGAGLCFSKRVQEMFGVAAGMVPECAAFILMNWDKYKIYDKKLEEATCFVARRIVERWLADSLREEESDDRP